jgi:hypothetical protein
MDLLIQRTGFFEDHFSGEQNFGFELFCWYVLAVQSSKCTAYKRHKSIYRIPPKSMHASSDDFDPTPKVVISIPKTPAKSKRKQPSNSHSCNQIICKFVSIKNKK